MALVAKNIKRKIGKNLSSIFLVITAILLSDCLSRIAKHKAYAQTAVKRVLMISSNVIDSIR